jgi:putative transposase
MAGTITLRRPRVRGLEARFESRGLPLFKRRTEEVGRLLPELYLHGLAHGDFDLALRGLLGEAAPLSAPSIARLKAGWQAEYDTWKRRRLDDLEPVYVWADGIYVKAGLEKDKAAMLVVIAALRDGRKVVLAVESGYRESTESWAALLRDRKGRGLRAPRLLIADGHLGIWGAVRTVFPTVREQRCWNHRVPGRARSKEVRRPPAGKTFTPASQRQVVAA